jgi:feruloyl esterase
MGEARIACAAAALAALTAAAAPAWAADCGDLAETPLAGAVTAAALAPAGDMTVQGFGGPQTVADVPEFCRVAATLTPTENSEIKIALWLPAAGAWNGKYLAVGNGGFAGSIGPSAMIAPLRAGYAVSATDTGHEGGASGAFALDREVLIDFAHRAVHEMAEASKTLIGAYYGTAPTQAYFNGCSTGGRQAITAASRYPADFDGIVAGAAAVSGARLHAAQTWVGRVGHERPGGPLSCRPCTRPRWRPATPMTASRTG